MGLKDWVAPFITLLIGASTIFISYKNYQAQAAAKTLRTGTPRAVE